MDLKPQFMSVQVAANTAASKYTETNVQLPVMRGGGRPGRYQIMEILKIFMDVPTRRDEADVSHSGFGYVSTVSLHDTGDTYSDTTQNADEANAAIIAYLAFSQVTTTSGTAQTLSPVEANLTDGAGNGVLVATDRLFFGHGNAGGTSFNTWQVRILYRLYDAGIQEYLGIVQSQQRSQ